MNVLGKTRNGYICDLSDVEMANLHGYPAINSSGYRPPSPGDSVQIPTLFRDGQDYQKDQSRLSEIKRAAQAIVDRLSALGV